MTKRIMITEHIEGKRCLAYLINEDKNAYGKFDEQRFSELNEFQKLLYEYSIPYACQFIKPIEIELNN